MHLKMLPGLSYETVAVLLPGFAINLIAKPGNKTAAVSWPDPSAKWWPFCCCLNLLSMLVANERRCYKYILAQYDLKHKQNATAV